MKEVVQSERYKDFDALVSSMPKIVVSGSRVKVDESGEACDEPEVIFKDQSRAPLEVIERKESFVLARELFTCTPEATLPKLLKLLASIKELEEAPDDTQQLVRVKLDHAFELGVISETVIRTIRADPTLTKELVELSLSEPEYCSRLGLMLHALTSVGSYDERLGKLAVKGLIDLIKVKELGDLPFSEEFPIYADYLINMSPFSQEIFARVLGLSRYLHFDEHEKSGGWNGLQETISEIFAKNPTEAAPILQEIIKNVESDEKILCMAIFVLSTKPEFAVPVIPDFENWLQNPDPMVIKATALATAELRQAANPLSPQLLGMVNDRSRGWEYALLALSEIRDPLAEISEVVIEVADSYAELYLEDHSMRRSTAIVYQSLGNLVPYTDAAKDKFLKLVSSSREEHLELLIFGLPISGDIVHSAEIYSSMLLNVPLEGLNQVVDTLIEGFGKQGILLLEGIYSEERGFEDEEPTERVEMLGQILEELRKEG